MDNNDALLAFSALSQGTRLDVFRLLVTEEPDGLAAGEIARRVCVPHNTLSAHLAILSRAGLVHAERRSRSIIYRANTDCVRDLAAFLMKDCCHGRPDICAPLIASLASCGVSKPKRANRREAGHAEGCGAGRRTKQAAR